MKKSKRESAPGQVKREQLRFVTKPPVVIRKAIEEHLKKK
jgi:hypothetical protein